MPTIPIDVLIHITDFIDHPVDLLSFAATTRVLYFIIVPRHIDYRRICYSKRSSKYLWRHLLNTPYDACSRIRYLNVSRAHGRTQIPRRCITESEWDYSPISSWSIRRDDHQDGSFEVFIQVLPKMVNLKSFQFEIGNRHDEEFNLISNAIGKADCNLEELGVFFECPNTALEERFKNDKVSRDPKKFSLFYDYLPSLRKFIVRTGSGGDLSRPILQMVLNAPNLTHISVTLCNSHTFISGYWPNLQHLKFICHTLNNPTDDDNIPRLQAFLHRHTKLRMLSTDNLLIPGWEIESDDFLPNLTSFYAVLDPQLPITMGTIAARLVHLIMSSRLYSTLSKHGIILPNLKTCQFWKASPGKSTRKFADMAPNLQNLNITFNRYAQSSSGRVSLCQFSTSDEVIEHISYFANFKKLRVLTGPFHTIRVDIHRLFKTLYDFPNLLYTKMWLNDEVISCRLVRDDIAKTMKYELEATGTPKECDYTTWDELYTSVTLISLQSRYPA